MKRKIDFPEWLNWRFTIKFLRLLMERQATYGEASWTQKTQVVLNLSPNPKQGDRYFKMQGTIFYHYCSFCVLAVQSCLTLCNLLDCSLPGSSVHRFPRQKYWSGLPFPSPGDLPNPGIEPGSPTLQADSLLPEPCRQLYISSSRGSHNKNLVLYWRLIIFLSN